MAQEVFRPIGLGVVEHLFEMCIRDSSYDGHGSPAALQAAAQQAEVGAQRAEAGAAEVGAVGDSPSSHVLLGQARKLGRAVAQLLGDVGARCV